MKNQIKKKAAPRIEKVDLSGLEALGLVKLIVNVIFGTLLLLMISDIQDDVRKSKEQLVSIKLENYDISESSRYLNKINHNLYILGKDWQESKKPKAGKK